MPGRYRFGPFELDADARRLTKADESIVVSTRAFDVLAHLVAEAGRVVSKNALIDAAWADVAVTDNSLEQAVSLLRRLLGPADSGGPYIETVPRQGYRFVPPVTRLSARTSDAALDRLLAPHRAWIEGRAALESFERAQIARAREAFASVLADAPDQASAHVGLANACVMQFEVTRADEVPDLAARDEAVAHAREACRLDPRSGESWATLGFVLSRSGDSTDALAASRRAVVLEPDNWRHHLRRAWVGWGEERLRAARRTLELLPGFPAAHWLAATVHVARHALGEAQRELAAGLAAGDASGDDRQFHTVALHWLTGLVDYAGGAAAQARAALRRELAAEGRGHLYSRECCANAWYALGAIALHDGRADEAVAAFTEALARVAGHPLARVGLSVASGSEPAGPGVVAGASMGDRVLADVAGRALTGDVEGAAVLAGRLLLAAPPGSAGWLLPVDPLLRTWQAPAPWAAPLARLRARAT